MTYLKTIQEGPGILSISYSAFPICDSTNTGKAVVFFTE